MSSLTLFPQNLNEKYARKPNEFQDITSRYGWLKVRKLIKIIKWSEV